MSNNNPFLNVVCLVLGGCIVLGLSTHAVGDSAAGVCDIIHKLEMIMFLFSHSEI